MAETNRPPPVAPPAEPDDGTKKVIEWKAALATRDFAYGLAKGLHEWADDTRLDRAAYEKALADAGAIPMGDASSFPRGSGPDGERTDSDDGLDAARAATPSSAPGATTYAAPGMLPPPRSAPPPGVVVRRKAGE
jgi:hypothetical protein